MSLLRWLWPWLRRHAGRMATTLLLSSLTLAAGIGLVGVAGWFLTGAALAGSLLAFNLFAPSALVRGLSFLRIASRYGERLTGHAVALKLLSDLRSDTFRRLIPLTPGPLARHRHGDLAARLTGDIDAMDAALLLGLLPTAAALSATAALAVALGTWSAAAGWTVMLVISTVLLALPPLLRRWGDAASAAALQQKAALQGQAVETVDAHADLLALGASELAKTQFANHSRLLSQSQRRQGRITAAGQCMLHAAFGLCLLAVLWFGLPALNAGHVSGPVLAGSALAVLALFEGALVVVRGTGRLGAAQAAAERLQALRATPAPITDPTQPQPLPAREALRAWHAAPGHALLSLDAVRFRYPGSPGPPVLDHLSLQVAAGERVALIGRSGSGKTTILHLLLRLQDPDAGSVRIAGLDLRQVAQADLHRHVALLSQDAPIFLGTLRSNLRLGDPDADDARLWSSLEDARLADWVRSLPRGLDTWTGESGHTLSAGQARRLCLARVLLTAAPILLLDEPTAGLDAATEIAFFETLAQATAGRSVLMATHAHLPPGAVDRVIDLDR